MAEAPSLPEEIRTAAVKRVVFLPHAARQMSRPERMISASESREVLRDHGRTCRLPIDVSVECALGLITS